MALPPIADVVVVGGGPAGAAAAITLTEAGHQVVLVDKATFPRDKVCGDGLTTGALRILEDLGLDPTAVASWTPVDDVHVGDPTGRVTTFPLPRNRGAYAVVARRADLDAAVLDRARAVGVVVVEDCEVTGATDLGDQVTLRTGQGDISAPWIVAADGMWSPLRKHLGVATPGYLGEWHAFRQYFRHTGPATRDLWVWFEPDLLPGYVWSFPLPGGGANVGFGIQRGAKVATREMKALWPAILARPHIAEVLGPDAEPEARHQAWPIPARIDDIPLTAGRTLWVGDAAAATDPMTGEGIAQALLSGILAARAVHDGWAHDPERVRSAYEQSVQRELVADHKLSMLLIRALRHRRGARVALRLAGATAWTRRNFARWLFEDEPRAVVVTPRRWHRRFLGRDGAYRT